MQKAIIARDALMDVVRVIRSTYPETEQDALIDPMERTIRALGLIISSKR